MGLVFYLLASIAVSPSQGGERSAELAAWLSDVRSDRALETDALWRALEWDAWPDGLGEALVDRLERCEDVETRQVLDTLLDLRGVPHRCPGVASFLGRAGEEADALFPLPVERLELPVEALRAQLEEGSIEERERAAVMLVLRGEGSLRALRSFLSRPGFLERGWKRNGSSKVDPCAAWAWIRGYAGSAVGEAIAAELDATEDDARRAALLAELARATGAAQRAGLHAFAAFAERDDELGASARALLAGLADLRAAVRSDWSCHTSYATAPIEDAELEAALARALASLLEARAGRTIAPEALELCHAAGLRSAKVREALEPALVERLERREAGWFEALRMLGHFRVCSEPVRRAYLETLANWKRADPAELDRLPCWSDFDTETAAAFERVFHLAWSETALIDRLAFAGRLDPATDPLVAELFAAAERGDGADWALLADKGFRYVSSPRPEEPRIVAVQRLGLSIATLRASGEDSKRYEDALGEILLEPYEQDGAGGYDDWRSAGFEYAVRFDLRGPLFVEAALKVFATETPFWSHADAALELLHGARLTRDQALALAARPPEGSWDEWFALLLADEELRPAVERVARRHLPRIRAGLYAGDPEWLGDLLALMPLVPRDEDYLLAMLERGALHERLEAIGWVREFALDTARLRSALSERSRDGAPEVRAAASALVAERAW